MNSGDILLSICPAESPIESIDVCCDNEHVAVAQCSSKRAEPTLSIVNITNGETVKVIEKTTDRNGSVWKVKYNKSCNKLVYLRQNIGEFELTVFDLNTNHREILKTVEGSNELKGFIFHPISGLLILPLLNGEIEFWDLEKREIVGQVSLLENINLSLRTEQIKLSYSNDGKILAVGNYLEKKVLLYETEKYKVINELNIPFKTPGCLKFDNEDRVLFVLDFWQKGVFAWDISTNKRFAEEYLNDRKIKVRSMDISENNDYFVFGYNSASVNVFSFPESRRFYRDKEHEPRSRVNDIRFTPDGKKLISAGEDWQLIVRSMEDI